MAIGDRIYIADKTTLDEVNTKCTTIQTNTNNLNSRLTSTRAGYLDYLANGTYGLNAIKNAINTVDNNVDSIKTYTTTNNTGSKTGVLSQKSSYIINMLENSTYGLNAIKTSVNNVGGVSDTGTGNTIVNLTQNINVGKADGSVLCKFIAPMSGKYNISGTALYEKTSSSANSSEFQIYKLRSFEEGINLSGISTYPIMDIEPILFYDRVNTGSDIAQVARNTGYFHDNSIEIIGRGEFITQATSTAGNSVNFSGAINCCAGEAVIIIGATYHVVAGYSYITKITVTYG